MANSKRHPDGHIDQRLRSEPIIWLSSTQPDGRPHIAPMWFLWDGSSILLFSLPNTKKICNIQHNPAVVLSLDSAKQGDDIVMLEGRAVLIDDPNVRATMPAFAEKYASLRSVTAEEWAAQFAQAIRITPTMFISWAK